MMVSINQTEDLHGPLCFPINVLSATSISPVSVCRSFARNFAMRDGDGSGGVVGGPVVMEAYHYMYQYHWHLYQCHQHWYYHLFSV